MTDYLGSPKVQFFNSNTQRFLTGGALYAYVAGSTTPTATYPTPADALAATNANTWPVVLDARGEADVVLSGATKLILRDEPGGNIIWTVDNINSATSDILDIYGKNLITFTSVLNAVNNLNVTNAITGTSPILASAGTNTNVGFKITTKGSGALLIDAGSTGTIDLGTTSTGAITLHRDTTCSGALTVSGAFNLLPAGIISQYGGTTAPTGWLECDGSAISRTTYATLFAIIGTTYGAGDGSTTFNLPNQARRVLVGRGGAGTATLAATVGSTGGEETHTLTTAEMPAHTHTYSLPSSTFTSNGGNPSLCGTVGSQTSGSTGGGGAHNVIQPSLVVMFIIKA